MEYYLFLKLAHIVAAVVVAGTGAGIAFFMFMANRSNNPQAVYVTAQHVVAADWIFTMPAVIIQIITGLLLMRVQGYSFSSPWFYWVVGLFSLIGLCWLPVLYIQYRLRELAKISAESNVAVPGFKSWMRVWTLLGTFAFGAILVMFWLMVFKPFPVV